MKISECPGGVASSFSACAAAMHWGPRRGRRAARRGVGGTEAGTRDRPRSPRTWRVGGAGEGAWSRVSAARRRRNGRVAPYAAARLTGRARGRAGRQNVGNSPAHPTSPCSPQSARGGPRHVGCSAIALRRHGRVAPYAAARLTGRARGPAGRQNAGNSPAHPTSLFSPPSAHGEPRHAGRSAS